MQIEWVLFALSCNCRITFQHFHNEEAAQSSSRKNISNCEIISYETNNVYSWAEILQLILVQLGNDFFINRFYRISFMLHALNWEELYKHSFLLEYFLLFFSWKKKRSGSLLAVYLFLKWITSGRLQECGTGKYTERRGVRESNRAAAKSVKQCNKCQRCYTLKNHSWNLVDCHR